MADATIIMAGGSGTRLWPASVSSRPKQLMRIGGRLSLIQQALLRAAAATPNGPLVIVTNKDHVAPIAEHVAELSRLPDGSAQIAGRVVYLPEPVGRNTAPAIALGVRYVAQELGDQATTLVITSDHVIRPVERFAADCDLAAELARAGNLVCFGIVPTHPETGFGYIQAGAGIGSGSRVDAFKEKPDLPTAEAYLSAGNYYWNAGMFSFTAGAFWTELIRLQPAIAAAFESAPAIQTNPGPGLSVSADPNALVELYSSLPKISVDYAVMERSDRVAVIPASFEWYDVGSWDQVAELAESTPNPTVIEVEATGNHIDADMPVAICGVSDIHVVIRNGRVLVCRRGSSQLVKDVVETAANSGRTELL